MQQCSCSLVGFSITNMQNSNFFSLSIWRSVYNRTVYRLLQRSVCEAGPATVAKQQSEHLLQSANHESPSTAALYCNRDATSVRPAYCMHSRVICGCIGPYINLKICCKTSNSCLIFVWYRSTFEIRSFSLHRSPRRLLVNGETNITKDKGTILTYCL